METTEQVTIEQAIDAGGTLWQKAGSTRVYFNLEPQDIGLDYTTYRNSAWTNSATLNGDHISHARANEIRDAVRATKVWIENGQIRMQHSNVPRRAEWVPDAMVQAVRDRLGL